MAREFLVGMPPEPECEIGEKTTWREHISTTLPHPFLSYPVDIQRCALAADKLPINYATKKALFLSHVFFINRPNHPIEDISEEIGCNPDQIREARDQIIDDDEETLIPPFLRYKQIALATPTFADIPRMVPHVAQSLPMNIQRAIRLYMQGATIDEIKDELDVTYNSAKTFVSKGRRYIEDKFLFPNNFQRVAASGIDYNHAIHPIPATLFMEVYYSTPLFIAKYKDMQQVEVDQELLAEGYLLLTDHTNFKEYNDITRSHKDLLVLRKGRYYIRPEVLQQYREHEKLSPTDVKMKALGYYRVAELATSRKEYEKLIEHPAVQKVNGKYYISYATFQELKGEENSQN